MHASRVHTAYLLPLFSLGQVLLQVEGHEGLGDAIAFQHWALGSVHGCHGQGTAGQGTAAFIDVGIGVLDDCTVGTLHGHSYVMDLALLTAGALMLRGLGLQGVPVGMGGVAATYFPYGSLQGQEQSRIELGQSQDTGVEQKALENSEGVKSLKR
ncbi:hypothetical protein U0070_013172 [Myodes glareolus]|uniref:Secreted protein n=1 Tax=Myodes glareolus TaxID=447135 RepID=A0AAW0HG60_MYOGA